MKRALLAAVKLIGVLIMVGLVMFAVGVLWPIDPPMPGERSGRLLITGVTVVDVESGALMPDHEILIEDGIISEVGRDLGASGADLVARQGQFAIPGLFDMHSHAIKMAPVLTHPLFVANGVTAVRDLGGCLSRDDPWVACADDKRAWTQAVASGTMVGPRFDHVASMQINGGPEVPDGEEPWMGAATAEDARRRVAFDKARGIDFLKPYSMLPREGFFALAAAARENDMYLAGHLPLAVSAHEAVDAG